MNIGNIAATGRWWMLAACAAAGLAVPAEAQQLITSPDTIRGCLCQQQSISRLTAELTSRRQSYEDQKRAADSLVAEADSRKSKVDINDPNQIAAYSDLIGRRDAALHRLSDDATPRYSSFVASYNQRVSQYNQQCPGQSFDATVMKQVQQNLVCPAE